MATTSPVSKITTSPHVNDELGSFHDLSADELATIILYQGKPVTAWELAAKLGDGYAGQASVILDGLTAEGILARFRAGFNNYYALPRVAFTEKEPTLGAIVSDSLKSLLLGCRYRVARHLTWHLT